MAIKKLKLVEQLDKDGCTTACLAMLLNKSYFDMRKYIHLNVERFKNHYNCYSCCLYFFEIKEILDKLKIKNEFIKFESFDKLKGHNILSASIIGPVHSAHSIIFDGKTRKILDPSRKSEYDHIKHNYNIYKCIQIGDQNARRSK